MFSILPLLALLLTPGAPVDPRPFTPGTYTIEQRVASDVNRYAGTSLDFLEGGDLLWVRDGEVFALMKWTVTADTMRIEDAELCPLAPVALYKVTWQGRGYIFDKISDDCHERAASATSLVLVPMRRGAGENGR